MDYKISWLKLITNVLLNNLIGIGYQGILWTALGYLTYGFIHVWFLEGSKCSYYTAKFSLTKKWFKKKYIHNNRFLHGGLIFKCILYISYDHTI